MTLTYKQKLFIEFYMSNGMNATQAAISAGYSKKTADVIGSENLVKPNIKAEVERLQGETADKLQITKESLIHDLIAIKNLCLADAKSVHNATKAIEVISKMLGFNEPIKTENKITGINLKDLISFDDE